MCSFLNILDSFDINKKKTAVLRSICSIFCDLEEIGSICFL